MIVEKLLLKGVNGVRDWIYGRNNIITDEQWDEENTLRIFYFEDVDAVVERGKFSSVKPELPIGTLVNNVLIEDRVVYFENPYWLTKFGKSCVFNNDARPYQLFLKGGEEIDYRNSENILITQLALRRVLATMDIPIELFTDADVYLLPSRDKFACGYSRMIGRRETVKRRLEGGWISCYIDHDLFQELLPPVEYSRFDSHDPDHAGIDGIENKYPDFDREDFLTKWIAEICNIIGDTVTEIREVR